MLPSAQGQDFIVLYLFSVIITSDSIALCLLDLLCVLEATKSVFQCALLETLQKYCSTGSLLLTFC